MSPLQWLALKVNYLMYAFDELHRRPIDELFTFQEWVYRTYPALEGKIDWSEID